MGPNNFRYRPVMMKGKRRVLFTIAVAFLLSIGSGLVMAQTSTAGTNQAPLSKAVISFTADEFDFGDATQGEIVKHSFVFRNSGTEPLIIAKVLTTCGCTVPKFPKEPILPGAIGRIEVNFNTEGKMGRQNKIVNVMSNATTPDVQLTLRGTVLKARAKATADPNDSR